MNPGIHYKFTSQQLPPLAISLALFFTMYSFAVSQFEGHTSPLFFMCLVVTQHLIFHNMLQQLLCDRSRINVAQCPTLLLAYMVGGAKVKASSIESSWFLQTRLKYTYVQATLFCVTACMHLIRDAPRPQVLKNLDCGQGL